MSDGREKRIAYPLIAGMCALVLVGGPVATLMVLSAKQAGKARRHVAVAPRQQDRVLPNYGSVKKEYPSARPSEAVDQEKAVDPETVRVKELIRKLEEPKKNEDLEPPKEQPAEQKPDPPPPPPAPAEEKETDRSGSLARSQLSPEEQMLEIIRAFIVRQLAYPDGFAIVDHTKPQRVKVANQKPAQIMRVGFRAQDGSGRARAQDFLFVVQNDEVVEHAPTAVYVAAERAKQQTMLQVALLNQAILQQQLQAAASTASGGGGGGGFSGGFSRGTSAAVGGGCVLRGG
jgi:hypothetical protein